MENLTNQANRINRKQYAGRFLALLAFMLVMGVLLGAVAGSIETFFTLTIVVNIVVGCAFVYFSRQRAFDAGFEGGKLTLMTVVSLPTLILPQFGILIFIFLMFLKSK